MTSPRMDLIRPADAETAHRHGWGGSDQLQKVENHE